jgi:hypothetical protein
MKKINALIIISLSLIFIASCKKDEADFYESLGKGTYLTFVATTNTLDPTVPTNSVSQTVTANGSAKSVNLYVSATSTLDKTKWKLIKNIPYTGASAVLRATVAEIATALNITAASMSPGTVFNMYNEVLTETGQTFNVINTSGQDLESQPAFNLAMRWQAVVVCPAFSLPDHYNNQKYEVVRDDWQDFQVGDEINVKLGPGANEITLEGVYATSINHVDMVIKVNTSNGVATVDRYTYGRYPGDGNTYTAATTGSFNFLFPCTGLIDLNINNRSAAGTNFGNFRFILKKK